MSDDRQARSNDLALLASEAALLAEKAALESQNQALQEALKEAHVVIGAAALSAGGFLRITRKAMTEIDLEGELSSWGEPDCIVYTYHPRRSPTQETDPE